MHSFEHTPPEARELLTRPIRDLGLRLEGSTLEKYVQQLYAELAAKGPALRKLQYVDRIARELAKTPPRKALDVAIRELPVEEMRSTVEQFYREHQRNEAAILGDVPDAELEDIFVRKGEDLRPASAFLLEHRKAIVDKITYWTGVRRSLIRHLIETIGRRARELQLSVERKRESQTLVEMVAFATTLAMNYLTRGGFTEH